MSRTGRDVWLGWNLTPSGPIGRRTAAFFVPKMEVIERPTRVEVHLRLDRSTPWWVCVLNRRRLSRPMLPPTTLQLPGSRHLQRHEGNMARLAEISTGRRGQGEREARAFRHRAGLGKELPTLPHGPITAQPHRVDTRTSPEGRDHRSSERTTTGDGGSSPIFETNSIDSTFVIPAHGERW